MGDVASKTQGKVGTGGVSRFNVGTNNSSNTSKPPLSFEQAYPAAVEQTGEDYSNIMGGYQNLLDSANSNNGLTQNYQSILNRNKQTPQLAAPDKVNASLLNTPDRITASTVAAPDRITASLQNYIRDPDVIKALAGLKDLAETGGYSEQGIADLRARGISPIRSVYANSMRDMDRNKSLQGGYSPNFNAATSRMAREESDKIAGATQDVNAGIAQNVAANKLAAAPQYATASANESAAEQAIAAANTVATNRAGELNSTNINDTNRLNAAATDKANLFNAGNINDTNRLNAAAVDKANLFNSTNINDTNRLNNANTLDMNKFNSGLDLDTIKAIEGLKQTGITNKTDVLKGMQSLYGTNPALAALFGDQALQAAQLQQGATQANDQTGLNLINQTMTAGKTGTGGVSRWNVGTRR